VFVACKLTNEYCSDISKISNKNVLHGIRVKNNRDQFSLMTYDELVEYFKDTNILEQMKGIASNFYNPNRFNKNKKFKQYVARHLRYHLRGLSEQQTLYKFGYELSYGLKFRY
jgi:uncharacterized protein YehS (DUF1456 family)